MISLELIKEVGNAIDNKKGMDISIIDISNLSSFADYFINATAANARMIDAIQDEVEKIFAKDNIVVKSVEGKAASGWVLSDYGDVIVNVFLPDQREKYQIDKIWSDGEFIEFDS